LLSQPTDFILLALLFASGLLVTELALGWIRGDGNECEGEDAMSILWTIIIGFLAGVIARFFHPGNKYEPKGFILTTTVLGIVGAFVATYLGQAVGWYQAGEGAGFIGAIVGAIIVLVVWGMIAPRLERT
jgi:uncharacterized membrane protein YeaQ/YmgE (transglycosylase-associated protein family)